MNDLDQIQRARRGEEAVWADLMREHQGAAFRFAYLQLGDADEAEDVAQEAFIRAYKNMHRFDVTRPFRPWLLGIVANQVRNRRRSLGRYWRAIQRGLPVVDEVRRELEEGSQAKFQGDELWQAIRQLGDSDQKVLYLRYFLELSVVETAQALRVAEGTVKSRSSRAMRRLEKVINREFPWLEEGRRR